MGITLPFKRYSTALCMIFIDDDGCKPVAVDRIIQKTVIDVDEKGVDAAAVIMIGGVYPVSHEEHIDINIPILMIATTRFNSSSMMNQKAWYSSRASLASLTCQRGQRILVSMHHTLIAFSGLVLSM